MARKYTKRNAEYWNNKSKTMQSVKVANVNDLMTEEYVPVSAGEPFYSKDAARASRYSFNNDGNQSKTRTNSNYRAVKHHRFDNIMNGMTPFGNKKGSSYITAIDVIELCQKAYYNIAIFRNTIDMMSEFSNSDLEVKGGTAKSRKFVEKWLDRIGVWNLKGQFFREYYRSGNVFMYRFDGKFKDDQISKIKEAVGTLNLKSIPLKYIVINPAQIALQGGSTFTSGNYLKILSKYEIESLRNPRTDQDKAILADLPEGIRKNINNGSFARDGIFMPLNPIRLHYAFYKKQDYEPFGVPFGFPVLDDLNWKLEMKKQDSAVSRTIENAILLITMGNKETGEVNKKAMEAMQTLFLNENVGRVLVADATVSAKFIIPDLSEVINAEKYKVVNSDIKEGLQNIFASDSSGEKFSNMQIKIKVFFARLEEGRKVFAREFLQPEIKRVCREAGFKAPYPKVNFEEVDLNDPQVLMKIFTRLIEMGVLTPEEGLRAMSTGVLPEPEESIESQKRFRKLKEQGLYEPLIGNNKDSEEAGRPEGTSGSPQTTQKTSPIGDKKASLETFNTSLIAETMNAIHSLTASVEKEFRSKYKKKRLNKSMKDLASEFALTIASRYDAVDWETKLKDYMKDQNLLLTDNLTTVASKVDDIAAKYQIPSVSASILFHSKNLSVIKNKPKNNEN